MANLLRRPFQLHLNTLQHARDYVLRLFESHFNQTEFFSLFSHGVFINSKYTTITITKYF